MFELTPFERKNRHPLTGYNPFQELAALENELWGRSGLFDFQAGIRDTGSSLVIEADLPGFNKEDIEVNVNGDYLIISAKRQSESEEKNDKTGYIRKERSYGSFRRSFDISNIDADKISVSYKDGVLKLCLPKKDEPLPSAKRLEIE